MQPPIAISHEPNQAGERKKSLYCTHGHLIWDEVAAGLASGTSGSSRSFLRARKCGFRLDVKDVLMQRDPYAQGYDPLFMLKLFRSSARREIPVNQRVYAVGDVHGRMDLLDQLLAMLKADNAARPHAQVTLVMLGDLIDRGPASRQVVSRVRKGVSWARTVALMGNHEAVMLDVLDGQTDRLSQWLRFGGIETLESWGVTRQTIEGGTRFDILDAIRSAILPEERAWLGRMRTSLRIGDYYFVHAGVRPDVPLEKQTDDDRLWIREDFLDSRKKHGAMIVHGHSININVEERPNRIGLDTGAYATGRLTAVGLEGSERWFLATANTD